MFLSFSLSVNIVFVNEGVYYNGESVCLSVRPSLSVFLTTKGVCLRCSGVCNITCGVTLKCVRVCVTPKCVCLSVPLFRCSCQNPCFSVFATFLKDEMVVYVHNAHNVYGEKKLLKSIPCSPFPRTEHRHKLYSGSLKQKNNSDMRGL